MYSRLTLKRSHIYWGIVVLVVALIASPLRAPIAQAVEYLLKNQPDVSTATSSGPVLHIVNTGTDPNDMGTGLTGENQATSGPGWAFGLFGMTHSTNQGVGFNGWAATGGTSGNAIGAKATADGENNIGMLGIAYASAGYGFGMKGETYATGGAGMRAQNHATSGSGSGLSAVTSTDGAGIKGLSTKSTTHGVVGDAWGIGDGYGLWTEDKVYAGSGCEGCGGSSSALAINSSSQSLNSGDVVVLVGTIESLVAGATPKLAVVRASPSSAEQVVGVVGEGVIIETQEIPNPACDIDIHDPEPMPTPGVPDTNLEKLKEQWRERRSWCAENATITHTRMLPNAAPIPPNGYLWVVTTGLTQVQVEGPVSPGQLLVPSNIPGVAKAAPAAPAPGTVLGKVAGPPDPDTGLVPVFVTLQ